MSNSRVVQNLMESIYDLEYQTVEKPREGAQFQQTLETSCWYRQARSVTNIPGVGNDLNNEQQDIMTSNQSNIMSERGIYGQPFYSIAISATDPTVQLQRVVIQNSSLRRRISKLESKVQKYRDTIMTLGKLLQNH